MYPRKPLSHADQIARMRQYLRKLQTQMRHRYDEFFDATRTRRDCPFEVRLREKLLDATRDTVALAEACIEELRRQETMFYAPFRPGDRVVVEYVHQGKQIMDGPYLIIDIEPNKRRGFHYIALQLTKRGTVYARRSTRWLSSDGLAAIRQLAGPFSDEAEKEASYWRECAKVSRVLAFERGDLSMLEARKDYLGLKHFHRKDRAFC